MDIEKVINAGLEKVMGVKEWGAKDKLEFIRAVTILLERTQNYKQVQQSSQKVQTVATSTTAPQPKPRPELVIDKQVQSVNPYGTPIDNENERIVRNGIVYSAIPTEEGIIKYYQTTDQIGNKLKKNIEISEEVFNSLK